MLFKTKKLAADQTSQPVSGVENDSAVKKPLVSVKNFSLGFEQEINGKIKQILTNINLDVYQGEKLAIIGESGSGKTVLSTAISCLLGKDAIKKGSIVIDGYDVITMNNHQIQTKKIRGHLVSYVFQNPLQTMNPYLKIGSQLTETLKKEKRFFGQSAKLKKKVLDTLKELNFENPEKVYNSYPFQLSGGMIQRAVIACSLLLSPKLLILDEPTSALDAVVELQILEILNKIAAKGTTIILISHDLNLVSSFADRIAIMYAGRIVEYGTNKEINLYPQHPYTWGLLMATPGYGKNLYSIPGRVPADLSQVVGDPFAARNLDYGMDIDFELVPPFYKVSDSHYAATWLLSKHAPAYEPPAPIQKLWDSYLNNTPLSETEIVVPQSTYVKTPDANKVLNIKKMEITYTTNRGVSKVVHGVDLHVNKGEIVGLIGESGSGKSTIAKAVAGLQDFNAQTTKIAGVESPRLANQIIGDVRKRFAQTVQMIYQNPGASLHPFKFIWKLVGESLFYHPEFLSEAVRELKRREVDFEEAINETKIFEQILKINTMSGQLTTLKREYKGNQVIANSLIYDFRKSEIKSFYLHLVVENDLWYLQLLPNFLKRLVVKNASQNYLDLLSKINEQKRLIRENIVRQNQAILSEIQNVRIQLQQERTKLRTLQSNPHLFEELELKKRSFQSIKKLVHKQENKVHHLSNKVIQTYVLNALKQVGLGEQHLKMYPWQLSGGQQQRVAIVRSLMLKPQLLIADEPIASLDVSLQSDIISLISSLSKKNNMATLFISHDLEVLSQIANRVYVLYKGVVVETGDSLEIFANPIHPYTRMLVSSSKNKGYGKDIKQAFVFNPQKDYHSMPDQRQMFQINNLNHFVYGSQEDLIKWRGENNG